MIKTYKFIYVCQRCKEIAKNMYFEGENPTDATIKKYFFSSVIHDCGENETYGIAYATKVVKV